MLSNKMQDEKNLYNQLKIDFDIVQTNYEKLHINHNSSIDMNQSLNSRIGTLEKRIIELEIENQFLRLKLEQQGE